MAVRKFDPFVRRDIFSRARANSSRREATTDRTRFTLPRVGRSREQFRPSDGPAPTRPFRRGAANRASARRRVRASKRKARGLTREATRTVSGPAQMRFTRRVEPLLTLADSPSAHAWKSRDSDRGPGEERRSETEIVTFNIIFDFIRNCYAANHNNKCINQSFLTVMWHKNRKHWKFCVFLATRRH
jgi:hypothetical protein